MLLSSLYRILYRPKARHLAILIDADFSARNVSDLWTLAEMLILLSSDLQRNYRLVSKLGITTVSLYFSFLSDVAGKNKEEMEFISRGMSYLSLAL